MALFNYKNLKIMSLKKLIHFIIKYNFMISSEELKSQDRKLEKSP